MSQTPEKSIAKKAPSKAPSIATEYWHYLLTHGKRPASVYAFAHEIGQEESDFYAHAASFQALEAQYWESLISETVDVLAGDEDYEGYDAEQKLLAFFFTFFAHTQKHRSRLVGYFPRPGCYQSLKPMRHRFEEYAKGVIHQGVEDGSIADRKKLTEKYPLFLFEQLRGIIEFHRKDQSEGFQDTDAFIEKSVRFGADMARSGSIDSAFDLGRFLLRRFTLNGAS